MKRLFTLLISFLFLTNVSAQNLLDVDPDSGVQGETLELSITGQNTNFDQGSNSIFLRQGTSTYIYPQSWEAQNNNEVTATFTFLYNHPLGEYDMYLSNSWDGNMNLPNAFTLETNPDAPAIASINPDYSYQGETIDLTITGQNTNFEQGSNSVYLVQGSYAISSNSIQQINDEELIVNIDFQFSDPLGLYDVVVYNNNDGILRLDQGFELKVNPNPPQLISVTPFDVYQGTEIELTITGEYTHFTDGVYYLNIEGQGNYFQIYVTEIISDTEFKALIYCENYMIDGLYNLNLVESSGELILMDAINIVNPVPEFINTEFIIDEEIPTNTFIGDVGVIDNNEDLYFEITFWNEDFPVEVNASTGELYVNKADYFDYEINQSLDFELSVFDGSNTSYASITISINNLNDNSPTLEATEFTIYENINNNTIIGQVIGIDADGDLNPLTYEIMMQTIPGVFSIDENTGEIIVLDSIDINYEINQSMQLSVAVSDGLYNDFATITINIEDLDEVDIIEDAGKFLNIYPNPNYGEFIIEKKVKEDLNINIYNALGYLIETIEMTNDRMIINELDQHPSGVYYLSIQLNNNRYYKKLIKL